VPSVAELLSTWEYGHAAGERQRALLLHALARPGEGPDRLLAVPVGERDGDLYGLRRYLFGEEVPLRVDCADCGEELEFTLAVGDVVGSGGTEVAAVRTVEGAGWSVRFRLPTAADLAAAEAAGPSRARTVLLERCVEQSTVDGATVDPGLLPAAVQARVAEAAAEADPRADVRLDVPCPECGRRTKGVLDIASALWTELDAWARGTLLDVHLLASSYGWTEPEVLALSPLRRRYYLELAGHA
jgi:hypothetical protein